MSGIGRVGLREAENLRRKVLGSVRIAPQMSLPGTKQPGIHDYREVGAHALS